MGSIDPKRVLARVRLRDGGPWPAAASFLLRSWPFTVFANPPSPLYGVARLIVLIVHSWSQNNWYLSVLLNLRACEPQDQQRPARYKFIRRQTNH